MLIIVAMHRGIRIEVFVAYGALGFAVDMNDLTQHVAKRSRRVSRWSWEP
jgi:hypothetical protein